MLKKVFGIAALFAVMVPMAIMAQDATPEPTEEMMMEMVELPAVDPLNVTGDIIAAGSSTVFPLTERLAEAFSDEGYSGLITVDSIGSGGGFERFCVAGEIDIANASRPIEEDEVEACLALDPVREPLEFRVGTDAVTFVVSNENDFVTDLSVAQLSAILSGEATTWDQVDPSFPAEAIQVFSPGSDSGTFDLVLELTLEADAEDGGLGLEGEDAVAAISSVPGIQFSEDDNVLVQGIQGSPYAIGYFGFAYYIENQDALNAIAINGVEPNAETAESGEYYFSRPLFIYSSASVFAEKPQVADFVNFYLTNVNEYVEEVGYFPASEATLNAARQLWLDAVAMAGM
jgi:phosphate binding protein